MGSLADNTLSNRLSVENNVQRINVYDVIKPEKVDYGIMDLIKKEHYDLIIFTSPSTFYHFCSLCDMDQIGKLRMASIGSTTTKAINDAGFEPIVTAKKSSAEGLRDAIVEYYKNN